MKKPVDGDKPVLYRADCSQRRIHAVLNAKWGSLALYALRNGPMRTGQLQRSLSGISKKMLTQSLRDLERDGLVARKVFHVVPPMVEYSLTPLGQIFVEPIQALYSWSEKNAAALDTLEANRLASAARPKVRVGRKVPPAMKQAG